MEKKWTPGPWAYDSDAVVNHKGFIVADKGNTNWENNAHLIAAAPDLYEALAECVKWIEESPEGDNATRMAFNALSRARGE